MKDKLNDYKSNNLNKNDLLYYLAFEDIYTIQENATDEEIIIITDACMKAASKDEEEYSITKFTSFVAEKYFDKELTLDEIQKANPRDVITDAIDDNLYYIKQKEIER